MPNHFRFQQFFIFNSIDLAIFRVSCAQIKFMLWIVKTEKLVKNHPCLSFISYDYGFSFYFFFWAHGANKPQTLPPFKYDAPIHFDLERI